jgi:hypothetical protein
MSRPNHNSGIIFVEAYKRVANTILGASGEPLATRYARAT